MAETLLKYCAAFALFDGFQIMASSHLKGAGDTDYVMKGLWGEVSFTDSSHLVMSHQGGFTLFDFWLLLTFISLPLSFLVGESKPEFGKIRV